MRGAGFRMGPFELVDAIGADVNLAVSQSVYGGASSGRRATGRTRCSGPGRRGPAGTQERGRLLRLRGRWRARGAVGRLARGAGAARGAACSEEQIAARILATIVNEAASAVADGVAAPEAIDTAMRLGANYPSGPLEWGERIGLAQRRRAPSTRCTPRCPTGATGSCRCSARWPSAAAPSSRRARERAARIGIGRSSSTWTACCWTPSCSGSGPRRELFARHGAEFTLRRQDGGDRAPRSTSPRATSPSGSASRTSRALRWSTRW